MEAVGGDSGGVGGDSAREGAGPGRIINYRTDPFIDPLYGLAGGGGRKEEGRKRIRSAL